MPISPDNLQAFSTGPQRRGTRSIYYICFMFNQALYLPRYVKLGGRRGRNGMIVEFITTYAISAYHHLRCEFGPRSGEVYSIQHYVIKFVSDLRQVGGFIRILRFLLPIKLNATIQLEYC